MKHVASLFRSAVAAFGVGTLLMAPVQAAPRPVFDAGRSPHVQTVQADCYAIAQRVAAQYGGSVAKASPSTQGGQPVCVIVVVVPGKDGQRGQRQEVVVPAG